MFDCDPRAVVGARSPGARDADRQRPGSCPSVKRSPRAIRRSAPSQVSPDQFSSRTFHLPHQDALLHAENIALIRDGIDRFLEDLLAMTVHMPDGRFVFHDAEGARELSLAAKRLGEMCWEVTLWIADRNTFEGRTDERTGQRYPRYVSTPPGSKEAKLKVVLDRVCLHMMFDPDDSRKKRTPEERQHRQRFEFGWPISGLLVQELQATSKLLKRYARREGALNSSRLSKRRTRKTTVRQMEIYLAVTGHGGNCSAVARKLGLNPKTVWGLYRSAVRNLKADGRWSEGSAPDGVRGT